jgi:phage terminase large subunit-like protein
VDEIAKFQYPDDVWDNLELGLRLGDRPQVVVTTTPRPIPIIHQMLADDLTVISRVSTYANLANLAPTFIQRVLSKYEGTRLGRQELHAEVLSDTPGALWNQDLIEQNRIRTGPELARIVVGIDPAGSSEEGSDETGIVVCGKGEDGKGYVIRDVSGVYTPDQWARLAIAMYHEFGASRFVAEKNQGGEMVKDVIQTRWDNAPIRLVHSARNSGARAEPIAALYEQGKVKHVGMFSAMEDQMCVTTPDGYQGRGSADRMDAMVHAMRDLMMGAYTNPDPNAYASSHR